jgi:hypothetical protein
MGRLEILVLGGDNTNKGNIDRILEEIAYAWKNKKATTRQGKFQGYSTNHIKIEFSSNGIDIYTVYPKR